MKPLNLAQKTEVTSSHWLESLDGLWNWNVLTLLARYQWCHPTLLCHVRVTFNRCTHICLTEAESQLRTSFDPTYPITDEDGFKVQYWRHVYGNLYEGTPPNAPKFLGNFYTKAYCDIHPAEDQLTFRSRSDFLIMLNLSPIFWITYSPNPGNNSYM